MVGTPDLLLVSAAFLGLYAVALRGILVQAGEVRRDRARQVKVPAMVADPYSRTIFGLKTLSVLTAYLIEYVFYQQAARHFPVERALAGFLGVFSGGATIAMILVGAFVTGRLTSRHGVRGALSLMPLSMAGVSLAVLACGALAGEGSAFFALVVVTMLVNQVLEKAIYTPTLVLLFQPMPRDRRMPVRVAVEGWLGSAALILSGVLLLAVSLAERHSMLAFVALLAAASQDLACAALRRAGVDLDESQLREALRPQVERARTLLTARVDRCERWPVPAGAPDDDLDRVRSNLYSLLSCSSAVVGRAMRQIAIDAEARVSHGDFDDRVKTASHPKKRPVKVNAFGTDDTTRRGMRMRQP